MADALSAAIARRVAIRLVAAASAAAAVAVTAAVIAAAATTLTPALSTIAADAAFRTALACGCVVVLQWQARRRRRVDGALPSAPHCTRASTLALPPNPYPLTSHPQP